MVSSEKGSSVCAQKKKMVITNSNNENLVGILHETGSKEIVILCHGFTSHKNNQILKTISTSLEKESISSFRFDFSGNGDSQGSFKYGGYNYEVEDLHSIIQHFLQNNRVVSTILGHSRGGDIVLLYASKYPIRNVINISGRFDLKQGIRLGDNYLEKIKEEGFVNATEGKTEFVVTEESLMERLNTDMCQACLKIGEECKVLTIHGSEDVVVSVEDAKEFAKVVANHKLEIVEGANHGFSKHKTELVSVVLEFIKTVIVKN